MDTYELVKTKAAAAKKAAAKLILQIIHKMRDIRLITHQNLCRL